ncbi:MAG: amino acid permease [Phycisphaerae bacterium]
MASQLFAKKSLKVLLEEMAGAHRLRRALGPISLTSLGIGCVIGAGIFVATGAAARNVAGPSLMISYVVSGITCVLAALCYAEFASMAPVAGSAYTYAYATLGELLAWIIGWDLILEYAVGAAAVAAGWSGYFQKLLGMFNLQIPHVLQKASLEYLPATGEFAWTGAVANLPALVIVTITTVILVKGIRESAGFNALMVFLKVAAVLFVIGVGAFLVVPANWTNNFAPYGWSGISLFGIQLTGQTTSKGDPAGMLAGAAIIFFAYIGFDSVSTHAEEARRPQRDVPIAIVASLLICTVLYVGVVAVLTGMVPFSQISVDAGVSDAFSTHLPWASYIIAAAAVAGLTSVILVMMLSAPRVFMAMARDGLMPRQFFADVHPRFRTPWKSTIAVGVFVGVLAGFLPLDSLLHMTNIGTLFAFVIVCAAVLVMRRTDPNAQRPFRCPWVPVVPVLGIAACLMLMLSLPTANWWRLLAWMGIGLVIYVAYGRRHSVLGRQLAHEISVHGVSPAGMPLEEDQGKE